MILRLYTRFVVYIPTFAPRTIVYKKISLTLPPYLMPGCKVTVNLANSAGTLRATVTRELPITSYQLVVARLDEKADDARIALAIGSQFVLKIFDPRFIKRRFSLDDIPWSFEAEEAAKCRHNGALSLFHWSQVPESDDPVD